MSLRGCRRTPLRHMQRTSTARCGSVSTLLATRLYEAACVPVICTRPSKTSCVRSCGSARVDLVQQASASVCNVGMWRMQRHVNVHLQRHAVQVPSHCSDGRRQVAPSFQKDRAGKSEILRTARLADRCGDEPFWNPISAIVMSRSGCILVIVDQTCICCSQYSISTSRTLWQVSRSGRRSKASSETGERNTMKLALITTALLATGRAQAASIGSISEGHEGFSPSGYAEFSKRAPDIFSAVLHDFFSSVSSKSPEPTVTQPDKKPPSSTTAPSTHGSAAGCPGFRIFVMRGTGDVSLCASA